MQAAVLKREHGGAIAESLRGLDQLRVPIAIFRSTQTADGLVQFPGQITFGRGARFGGCLGHAGLQRILLLLLRPGRFLRRSSNALRCCSSRQLARLAKRSSKICSISSGPLSLSDFLNAVNMELPGRGYLFFGQVSSICEKRFCPIVHMAGSTVHCIGRNGVKLQYFWLGKSVTKAPVQAVKKSGSTRGWQAEASAPR